MLLLFSILVVTKVTSLSKAITHDIIHVFVLFLISWLGLSRFFK